MTMMKNTKLVNILQQSHIGNVKFDLSTVEEDTEQSKD